MHSEKQPVILVVDDTPDNLTLMNAILQDTYRVKVANNGEKALRIARAEQPPDLILLDIMMPGMNGYDVCQQLKADALTRDIPVIFLTALNNREDEQQGLELGAADYISKPVNPPVVLARIKTHLNLKAAADYLRDKNQFLEREVARRTREVQESYQLNRQIINCAQEGIIVHDRDLRFLVWNPFMEQLSGVPAADVIGKLPLEVSPFMKDTGALTQIEQALAGETLTGDEFPFTSPVTGKSGWTFTTAAPLRTATGEISGVIRTLRDITSQRKMEAQLRQSQKMEAMGQLAGGVAHDFNNILTVIMGYGNVLTMDEKLCTDQREYVEQILSASERAAQLTRGLLAFTRNQAMITALTDVNAIVLHVEKFLLRVIGEDIQLTLLPGEMKLPVNVDSGQIEQVLINLSTNARDAMPQGGLLTIATGCEEIEFSPDHPRGLVKTGRYAWIAVSDNGIGMDEETCNRIFEPFFTTKEVGKGTGLGMAIVYGIIQQHKGFIAVESKPARGTTFKIYLPIDETLPGGQQEKLASPKPSGGDETILLAEDDADVRTLMVSLLTNAGYRVIQAVDGEEAVEKFAANRDAIACVIMDMIMPKINGREAYEAICRMQPQAKVLYLTGYTPDFIRDRGIAADTVELIMKPVPPQELLRKIREMLDA